MPKYRQAVVFVFGLLAAAPSFADECTVRINGHDIPAIERPPERFVGFPEPLLNWRTDQRKPAGEPINACLPSRVQDFIGEVSGELEYWGHCLFKTTNADLGLLMIEGQADAQGMCVADPCVALDVSMLSIYQASFYVARRPHSLLKTSPNSSEHVSGLITLVTDHHALLGIAEDARLQDLAEALMSFEANDIEMGPLNVSAVAGTVWACSQ